MFNWTSVPSGGTVGVLLGSHGWGRGQFYLGFRVLDRPLNKLARRGNALGIMVEGTGSGRRLGDRDSGLPGFQ